MSLRTDEGDVAISSLCIATRLPSRTYGTPRHNEENIMQLIPNQLIFNYLNRCLLTIIPLNVRALIVLSSRLGEEALAALILCISNGDVL